MRDVPFAVQQLVTTLNTTGGGVCHADPNGSLAKGGSMEFVSMPLRASGRRPTTSVSQYDVESLRTE